MKRPYLIPSLIAAGIVPLNDSLAALPSIGISADSSVTKSIFRKFRLDHYYTLAGHSSHSSHASHASHRSSLGADPVYTPPVDPPIAPLVTLPGNTQKFKFLVMEVQLSLLAYHFYSGPVDGVISDETRLAISKMQIAYHLNVTGTITPEVLDTFRIVAQ